MRKLFMLLLISIFIVSCSEDEIQNECELEVSGLTKNCSDTADNCVYYLKYGPDTENRTKIEVDEKTFNYYHDKWDNIVGNEKICWEGKK